MRYTEHSAKTKTKTKHSENIKKKERKKKSTLLTIPSSGEDVNHLEFSSIVVGMQNGTASFKCCLAVYYKVDT